MNDIERTIGKLEEQGRWQAKKLETIEVKLDSLLTFKWKILGAIMFASFLTTTLIEIARAFGGSK